MLIEVKIALGQAVKGGIIIAKTKMEGLITAERIPSAYLVSIYDTERKQMLWNRADSNIEPYAYEHSSPVASPASTPRATTVNLVARDDRDLGDEPDASSAHAEASTAADESSTTARKRDQAEVTRSEADQQTEQPPSRVRRVFTSANTEPFTGDCPVCMTEYVSGQLVCSICGYEPLPVDESGKVKAQPNRRSRMLERRMQKLNEFGIFGDINTSLLQAITEEQSAKLQEAIGPRGLTSLEAATVRESKDRYKRALNVIAMAVMSPFVTGCIKKTGPSRIASLMTCWPSQICQIRPEQNRSYQLTSPPMPSMNTG